MGSEIYFTAGDPVAKDSLWKTDGTSEGTVLIKSLADTSLAPVATNFDQTFFYTTYDGQNVTRLWKSDGTPEGTGLVKEIKAGSKMPSSITESDAVVRGDGRVFFIANASATGRELWTSDGTAAGTRLVKDIRVGRDAAEPLVLTVIEGVVYFAADDGVHGQELWRSDGTEEGTFLISDVNSLPESSVPVFGSSQDKPATYPVLKNQLYFPADDGVHGRELWKLADINAAPSFTVGANVEATDLSGPQAIDGWAKKILAGPVDEAKQKVRFEVTADDATLFAVQPAIDATGKLTFTPRATVIGSTQIHVLAVDDGGTADGGVDRSTLQTFSIDVSWGLPWHNRDMPVDVTQDGKVVAGDALDVVNYINSIGSGPVLKNGTPVKVLYDVTGDDYVAADDVVTIVNYINAFGATKTGEGEANKTDAMDAEALLFTLAVDNAQQVKRRS